MAPDERAALLAYRTAVIFPVKVSESPLFPLHSAGATTSDAAASAEPRVDPPPTDSAAAKSADQAHEESSSSSSSSDSDSDSDSDDELSHVKTQTSEPTMQHQSGDLKVTSEVKDDSNESKPNYRHRSATEMGTFVGPEPDGCSAGTEGAAAEAVSEVLAEAEERGNTRESTEVTASPTGTEDVSTAALPADASTDVPAGTKGSTVHCAEAADVAGAEDAEVLESSSTQVEAAVEPTEAGKSAAEVPSPTESSEELMDGAPVIAESVGEDLQPEGPFEGTHTTLSLCSLYMRTPFSNTVAVLTFLRSDVRCNLATLHEADLC